MIRSSSGFTSARSQKDVPHKNGLVICPETTLKSDPSRKRPKHSACTKDVVREENMEPEIHSEIRRVLRDCAQKATPVTYRDLVVRAQVPPPHAIHNTTLALEDLIREDHAAGRPLLAALAVSRGNPGLPGHGFFYLLAELGRYDGPERGPEAAQAFDRELQAAINYWGTLRSEN